MINLKKIPFVLLLVIFLASCNHHIMDEDSEVVYEVATVKNGFMYHVYSYTEEMKGIYFNSINNYVIYVDDYAPGNNSIKIDLESLSVSGGIRADYPNETFIVNKIVFMDSNNCKDITFEINTHYYICKLRVLKQLR